MAERPIFIPDSECPGLVKEISTRLTWHPGFAPAQKKRNVISLHESAARLGYAPLLEVSTKSEEKVGQRLSAFNLKVYSTRLGAMPLECAFQGSKVFERGGPFRDLYGSDALTAKRDGRLRDSGRLTGFQFDNMWFPLEPKTVFYDWLYINALYEHREWLRKHILHYAGFTDIEFNPERSVNCQARSCALLVTLMKKGWLDAAVISPEAFMGILSQQQYRPARAHHAGQATMFPG